MNKTKELLEKIREAVISGNLPVENVPIDDIKQCVYAEIDMHRNTVTENHYISVMQNFQRVCAHISTAEIEVGEMLLWLDAMILCLDMLSDVIYKLANRAYWEYKHRHHLQDPQVQEIINYVDKKQKISLLSYEFVEEYDELPVEVFYDETCQMLCVPYKGRNMYFPKSWNVEKVVKYYRSVVAEQDERSPHCYRHEGYEVNAGDVVVDVGAAEGIFALDVMDIAGKVILIEMDEAWVEALEQTFKNDTDKVRIIRGFVDCVTEGNRLALDSLCSDAINYIKMDIEGYEKPALLGAERLLKESGDLKLAVCSYHCREDEEWIRNYLEQYGFETEVSKGFMCPDWTIEAYLEAELRRGIVFGKSDNVEN